MQVYSRIINSNIGNAGGLNAALNQSNAALNQPKRSRLFRHDVIQKKHSIIQQGTKSPPEHCIPTVETVVQPLFVSSFDRTDREQHCLQAVTVKVYLPLGILAFGIRYFNSHIAVERF